MQNIRNDGKITIDATASLYAALNYQPGDILEYVPNETMQRDSEV